MHLPTVSIYQPVYLSFYLSIYPSPHLVFDGARSVVHVVATGQQVQNWAVPLEGDVMALLSLDRETRCKDGWVEGSQVGEERRQG